MDSVTFQIRQVEQVRRRMDGEGHVPSRESDSKVVSARYRSTLAFFDNNRRNRTTGIVRTRVLAVVAVTLRT